MRLTQRLTLVLLLLGVVMLVACGGETAVPTPEPTSPPTTVPPTATSQPTTTPPPAGSPTPVPGSVSGQVLWGQQPVPAAVVELRAPDWRVTGDETAIASVTAGAAGQFLLAAVPPGDYSVVALWPDGAPNQSGPPAVALEPGQTVSGLTLKLEQALALLEPDLSAPVATLPTVRWEPLEAVSSYRVRIIDKDTTQLAVDAIVNGDRLDVFDQLDPSRDYTLVVSALGEEDDILAGMTGDFVTVDVPTPARALLVPGVCAQPGLPTFLDQQAGYCFAYPSDHFLTGDQTLPMLAGPPVGAGSIYFPNLSLAGYPLEGRDLTTWVDDYVAGLGDAAGNLNRVATTVAGRPAEILEPVPGEFSSRLVLVANGPNVEVLSFAPTFRDIPAADQDFLQRRAQTAADNLFETVIATMAFLPQPGEEATTVIELPAACDIDGMGVYVGTIEAAPATSEDADADVSTAQLCFAVPTGFTAQRTPQGLPRLLGPALDASLSPVRATFALEPLATVEGRTLEEIVRDYTAANGDADTVQTETTLGGEAAVLLDNLPAGRGSQELFALYDGQVYHLIFQPDPDEIPVAEADMARLMTAVLGSFSFVK